jgi:hypothetical protein
MPEPKLLPCPFCAGEAEIESEGLNEHRGYSIASSPRYGQGYATGTGREINEPDRMSKM